MEWYRLIFFHVFKVYYKDGNYKNDVPWFTATVLISASLWTYFTSAMVIFVNLLGSDFSNVVSKNVFIGLAFVFVIVNTVYFKRGARYIHIFRKHRHSANDKRSIGALSWFIVIGGLLSLPVTVFFLNFESLSDWLSMWKR